MTRAPALGLFGVGVVAGVYAAARQTMGGRAAAIGGALLGAKALEMASGELMARRKLARWQEGTLRLTKTIAINRGVDELYAYWRRLQNLPRILSHVEAVEIGPDNRSHWVMRLPGGAKLAWDAELTHEEENSRLAWRSVPGSELKHVGAVEFASLGGQRGTRVAVEIEIQVPGSRLRKNIVRMLGELPEQRLAQDLREFKQLMETGEIATTEGQPSGRRSAISRHLP